VTESFVVFCVDRGVFYVSQESYCGLDHFIVEVSRWHTVRHTHTLGRTSLLDEGSARRRTLYPITLNTHNRHRCTRRVSTPLSQQASGHWARSFDGFGKVNSRLLVIDLVVFRRWRLQVNMEVLCADGGLQRPHFTNLRIRTVDEVPSRSIFAVVTHPDSV
jgi:hypothetical protein